MHSDFSDDGFVSMEKMIESAICKDILEIAVTDHYDPDYADPEFPFEINFKEYHHKLIEVEKKYHKKIKVLKGIEIGIQDGATLLKCETAVTAFPYDFVLGSFHCAYGQALYVQYFQKRTAENGIADFYIYMLDCLMSYQNFDVLGHFNVIDRYVDYIPDYAPYMEHIEAILKILVQNGKGIEFNTSSFRYGMGNRTTPSKEILSLYKNLGGEIITIGSDAHKPDDVGANYKDAVEIIKSHGFRYLSTFENRKIKFIPLD